MAGYVNLLSVSVVVGLMVIIATVYYQSEYGTEFSCSLENVDLSGKIVVVTGANTGIGYSIALEAAKRYT